MSETSHLISEYLVPIYFNANLIFAESLPSNKEKKQKSRKLKNQPTKRGAESPKEQNNPKKPKYEEDKEEESSHYEESSEEEEEEKEAQEMYFNPKFDGNYF